MKKYIALVALLSIAGIAYGMEAKFPTDAQVYQQLGQHGEELIELYKAMAEEGTPVPTGENASKNDVLKEMHPTIALIIRCAFEMIMEAEGHEQSSSFKSIVRKDP